VAVNTQTKSKYCEKGLPILQHSWIRGEAPKEVQLRSDEILKGLIQDYRQVRPNQQATVQIYHEPGTEKRISMMSYAYIDWWATWIPESLDS